MWDKSRCPGICFQVLPHQAPLLLRLPPPRLHLRLHHHQVTSLRCSWITDNPWFHLPVYNKLDLQHPKDDMISPFLAALLIQSTVQSLLLAALSGSIVAWPWPKSPSWIEVCIKYIKSCIIWFAVPCVPLNVQSTGDLWKLWGETGEEEGGVQVHLQVCPPPLLSYSILLSFFSLSLRFCALLRFLRAYEDQRLKNSQKTAPIYLWSMCGDSIHIISEALWFRSYKASLSACQATSNAGTWHGLQFVPPRLQQIFLLYHETMESTRLKPLTYDKFCYLQEGQEHCWRPNSPAWAHMCSHHQAFYRSNKSSGLQTNELFVLQTRLPRLPQPQVSSREERSFFPSVHEIPLSCTSSCVSSSILSLMNKSVLWEKNRAAWNFSWLSPYDDCEFLQHTTFHHAAQQTRSDILDTQIPRSQQRSCPAWEFCIREQTSRATSPCVEVLS